MSYLDWEFFETEVTSNFFSVTDHGPLLGPVTNFKITRNKKLELILETTSASDSTCSAVDRPAGLAYIETAEVKLESHFGTTAVATGVTTRSKIWRPTSNSQLETITQTSFIKSIKWTCGHITEPHYLIEWVENLSASFIWPHSDKITKTGEECRRLHSPKGEVVLSRPIEFMSDSRSCVHIIIEGIELFIGKSRAKTKHIVKPGFILYVGTPDESTRLKIRNCLSFCLGNFLVYLGETTLNSQWHPVTFNAESGHALVEIAPKLSGWQPAPLGLRYEHEITPELLGRMASSLYKIYDTYQLGSIFWSYWHAFAAPVHMAAVHYGSTIESLQKAFVKASGSAAFSQIVQDKKVWQTLNKNIVACIKDSSLSDADKLMLTNKMQNINSAPQSVIIEKFFSTLGLEIGSIEKTVWKNRNRAAHGGGANADNHLRLIRENNVLLIMVNRILLKLGDGSDFYYDYYSLGRPTIRLTGQIQDDQ